MNDQSSTNSLAFDRLRRQELGERSSDSLLVIPVGATEQHGPNLPTGTDTLHTSAVAAKASQLAAATIPIVLAPTLPFGCSEHHLPFGATLSLSSQTLLSVLLELGASAVRGGFKRVFFLNGHGGNHEVVQLAARDLALSFSCHAAGGSWWDMARADLMEAGARDFPRVPGHAGAFEAAIVSALEPGLLRLEAKGSVRREELWRRDSAYRAEYEGFWQKIDGYSDDPTSADLSAGDRLVEAAARAVARCLIDFYTSVSEVETI